MAHEGGVVRVVSTFLEVVQTIEEGCKVAATVAVEAADTSLEETQVSIIKKTECWNIGVF